MTRPPIQPASFSKRVLCIIPLLLLIMLCAAAPGLAENKIGLDLEWRPIKGVAVPPAAPKPATLHVDTEPSGATIRILNIVPKFQQGMELEAGRYHVEVSASGYETHEEWVAVSAGEDKRVRVVLDSIRATVPRRTEPAAGPGGTWTDPVTGMEFVWEPGGCFQMGCGSWAGNCDSDEKPVHEVCLDGFWMGKYEVTQGQWEKVMGGNPARFKGNNRPVEQVSWNDCRKFIERLNGRSSGSYRFGLPTEAQWEYACRSGGKPEKYAGGDDVDRVAWYGGNSGKRTHDVGTKSPNGLGIYDMSGNVWEWCEDIYAKDAYSKHSGKNPIYDAGGSVRVFRGGSWRVIARNVRCGHRSSYAPGFGNNYLGFRLIRTN